MASKIRALTEQRVDVPRAVHLTDADRCCLTDVKLKAGVRDFFSISEGREGETFPPRPLGVPQGSIPVPFRQEKGIEPRPFEAISAAPVLHHSSTTLTSTYQSSASCVLFFPRQPNQISGLLSKKSHSLDSAWEAGGSC